MGNIIRKKNMADNDGLMAPIVIDCGSGVVKAGTSGEEKPQLVFNTYVGRPKHEKVMYNALEQKEFIGADAEKYKGVIKLSYPLEHGAVRDWDDMKHIYRYIFD